MTTPMRENTPEARLLALHARIGEAPDAVPRLRRFVLDLVLDAGQPAAWRAALQALLASPSTLADKGARARDHYERRYHTDRLLAAWVEALQGE